MLHELAADDGRDHRGDVEPKPLLVDKSPALFESLAVLHQYGAAQRRRDRHRVSGQHQRQGKIAWRIELGDPEIADGRRDISDDQIAFAPIAEQRQKIGYESVDGFNDPGQIEQRDKGGDLERVPAVDLLEIVIERLRDQSDDLTQALDDIDQSKKPQEALDG